MADVNQTINIYVNTKNVRQAGREINKVNKAGNKMNSIFTKTAGIFAGVFAVDQIVDFTTELINLGQVAEGVRDAFDRLNEPALLQNLRDATGNTISDLELMQRAVQATNLGLDAADLPGYFEFAARRAAETGESVDYLVNSIVTGIGRGSVQILDNLGLSATDLRERMKETGDISSAAISMINEQLEVMRENGDLATSSTQQLSTAWDNFKLGLASFISGPGAGIIDWLTEFIQGMTLANRDPDSAYWNQLLEGMKERADALGVSLKQLAQQDLKDTEQALLLANQQLDELLSSPVEQGGSEERFNAIQQASEDIRILEERIVFLNGVVTQNTVVTDNNTESIKNNTTAVKERNAALWEYMPFLGMELTELSAIFSVEQGRVAVSKEQNRATRESIELERQKNDTLLGQLGIIAQLLSFIPGVGQFLAPFLSVFNLFNSALGAGGASVGSIFSKINTTRNLGGPLASQGLPQGVGPVLVLPDIAASLNNFNVQQSNSRL